MLRFAVFVLALGLAMRAWGGATVTGTVTAPALSPPHPVRVTVDAHFCGVDRPIYGDQALVDAAGRLDGAAVILEPTGRARLPRRKSPRVVTIVERNCSFEPRLSVVTIGTTVRIKNADPVLHALRVREPGGRLLASLVLPLRDQVVDAFVARRAGPVYLEGDAGHSWMSGAVLVVEPGLFDTTDARGQFSIEDVPPGEYRLVVWHPVLGRSVRALRVGKTETRMLVEVEAAGL